jgi:hypothetical protein
MFFNALRIWIVFASASIVTAMLVMVFLSILSGILVSISNPFSLCIDIAILFLLKYYGVFDKIKSWNIPGKLKTFYEWVGWNFRDVFRKENEQ